MRICAVLNKDGGTLRTMDLDAFCDSLRAAFTAHGHEVSCRVVSGQEISAALKAASEDDAVEAILAGGGDGTISAAAALAFSSGKALGILPAGTMNLFARALGIPLELDAALAAIAAGEIPAVDIATANGRPFVHQFGVGIHARLVRIRNNMAYNGRVGKMLASLRAILAAAINPPRFEVDIIRSNGTTRCLVSGLAISNNPLDNGPVPVAAELNSGRLGVYLAASATTQELLNLMFDVVTGHWRENAVVSESEVSELVLRFPHRKRSAQAVVDGELIDLASSVTFKIHPGGLSVIRPAVTRPV